MFPLAGSFAGLPTLYGVIVRRRTAMGRMTGSRLFIYGMSRGDFEMWDRNRRNMLGTVDDMPQYRKYMTQALELAHKGAGWVNPNPLVGTVVVRDGEILAAGYHDATADRMRNAWPSTMPTSMVSTCMEPRSSTLSNLAAMSDRSRHAPI